MEEGSRNWRQWEVVGAARPASCAWLAAAWLDYGCGRPAGRPTGHRPVRARTSSYNVGLPDMLPETFSSPGGFSLRRFPTHVSP
eukprot:COSAG01_NODE_4605_length_4884_cov_10.307210_4_plen_84_part_00